jgi:Rrf2 family protein
MNSDFCVAVHALVYLNHHKPKICSSEELAENICTHPARVRRILTKLNKRNLLETIKSGPKGGYLFTGNPDKISLADIAEALNVTYVEPSWHSGNTDMECLIASGMGALMDTVFADLNKRCQNRLKEISIAHIDSYLFSNKNEKTQGEKQNEKS